MKKTAISMMSPAILPLLLCIGRVLGNEVVQLQRQADECGSLDRVMVVVAGHHFPEGGGCYQRRPHSKSMQRLRTYTKAGSPITLSIFGSQVGDEIEAHATDNAAYYL